MKENTERWRARVVAWRQSGESIAGYCRRVDLSASALSYWKRRFERDEEGDEHGDSAVSVPPRMARVRRVAAAEPSTEATQGLRVVFRSTTVEVPLGFDGAMLGHVLEVLAKQEAS